MFQLYRIQYNPIQRYNLCRPHCFVYSFDVGSIHQRANTEQTEIYFIGAIICLSSIHWTTFLFKPLEYGCKIIIMAQLY